MFLLIPFVLLVGFTLAAGKYDNHLWRIILLVLHWKLSSFWLMLDSNHNTSSSNSNSIVTSLMFWMTMVAIWMVPMWVNLQYQQRRQGCVLVTGCDSGMGQATVVYLAQSQSEPSQQQQQQQKKKKYDQIFAACFNPKASQEYFEKTLTVDELKYVTVVPLDVTKGDSVQQAAKIVQDWMLQYNNNDNSNNNHQNPKNEPPTKTSLTGLCMYHGIAYNGPAEYMPIELYERQLQVNFLGFLRVIQHVLPIMKEAGPDVASSDNITLPGRIVLTGTGGGPCSPCPPLLTAYMASKFATEAYCQALRQELYMTGSSIEAVMINPGFVKPTLLMEEGKKLTAQMWHICETKSGGRTIAKDTFGPLMDHFIRYSALQPGTHVHEVCRAAEHALLAPVPRSSYKVGIDSKLAPIVGMLPTGVRETIARHGIYGVLSPAGTVQGYRV